MEADDLNLMFGLGATIAAGSLLVYLNTPANATTHLALAALIGLGLPVILHKLKLEKRFVPMLVILVAVVVQCFIQVNSAGDLKSVFGMVLAVGLLVVYQLRIGQPILLPEAFESPKRSP